MRRLLLLLACCAAAPSAAQTVSRSTTFVASAGLLPSLRSDHYASGATVRVELQHDVGKESDVRLFAARSHWGRSRQTILVDRRVADRAPGLAPSVARAPYLEAGPTVWEIGAGLRYGVFSRRTYLYGLTDIAAAHMTAKEFHDSPPVDEWRLSAATGLGVRFRGGRVRPQVEARLVWYGAGDAEPRFAIPVTAGLAIAL